MGFVKASLRVIVCLGFAGAAAAQTTSGTISGHVEDISGGVLPGVTVTATSPALQGARMATHDSERRLRHLSAPTGRLHDRETRAPR